MKKLILLFTIVCVGQLFGMQDDLKDVIAQFKIVYDLTNLKTFTTVVHSLANSYNETTYDVAEKFKTKVGKEYITLGNALLMATGPNRVAALITMGADVNYIGYIAGEVFTPLISAANTTPETIQLLLNAGADPSYKTPGILERTALKESLNWLAKYRSEGDLERAKEVNEIIKLLTKAIKKQQ